MSRVLSMVLPLFLLAVSLGACTSKKDTPAPIAIEAVGKVRLVGSSIRREIVISGEGREWYIKPEEQRKLSEFQQQIVRVKGNETSIELKFANGVSAGTRYFLTDIEIIK